MFGVLFDELLDKADKGLVFIDHVGVLLFAGDAARVVILFLKEVRLTSCPEVLLEQLVILLPVHNCLPGRADLDPVVVRLAPTHLMVCVEPKDLLIAARVPPYVLLKHEERFVCVQTAVVHLSTYELLIAVGAPELLEASEHLPEDVLPRLGFVTQEHYELVDVPESVFGVLFDQAPKSIDKRIGQRAVHPLPLVVSKERAAVHAPVEHVVLLFEQELQLLHKQLVLQLVFLVLQVVQLVEGEFAG